MILYTNIFIALDEKEKKTMNRFYNQIERWLYILKICFRVFCLRSDMRLQVPFATLRTQDVSNLARMPLGPPKYGKKGTCIEIVFDPVCRVYVSNIKYQSRIDLNLMKLSSG